MNDNEDRRFPVIAPAQIGGEPIQTVNARDLHAFLEVGKVFGAWLPDRIGKYGFTENVDYVVFSETGKNSGGRPTKEYAISIDMAKELSMVERNAKGKEARQYFIDCERRVKQPADPMVALNDPAAMRGLLLTYTEKVIALEHRVHEMEPDVAAYERIAVADGSLCFTDAAKTLQVRPKDLTQFLMASGWVYQRHGVPGYIAYGPKLAYGLLEHKTTTVHRSDGTEKVVSQCRITPKGLARLAKDFPPAGSAYAVN